MPVNDNKKQNRAFEDSQDLKKGDTNNKRDTINSEKLRSKYADNIYK